MPKTRWPSRASGTAKPASTATKVEDRPATFRREHSIKRDVGAPAAVFPVVKRRVLESLHGSGPLVGLSRRDRDDGGGYATAPWNPSLTPLCCCPVASIPRRPWP